MSRRQRHSLLSLEKKECLGVKGEYGRMMRERETSVRNECDPTDVKGIELIVVFVE